MSLKLNNDTANGSVTLQASNTATGDVVATLPPFSTELAPRMQLMTAKTASGTSVDFTGIPSWAKRITVMFNGVSTNGTSANQIQLGYSGGIVTSGYLGTYGSWIHATAPTAYLLTTGFGIFSDLASDVRSGSIVLTNMGGNIWTCFGVLCSSSRALQLTTAGSIVLSGALDRLRLTTVNGTDTFDAGAINILVEG